MVVAAWKSGEFYCLGGASPSGIRQAVARSPPQACEPCRGAISLTAAQGNGHRLWSTHEHDIRHRPPLATSTCRFWDDRTHARSAPQAGRCGYQAT